MKRWLALLAALLAGCAHAAPITEAELRGAIADGAAHAAQTAMDGNGMARGDYDITTGRWTPYEPAWHTGQLVLALVDSYRITRDAQTLAAAQRGAAWWQAQAITGKPAFKGMINAWHGGPLGRLINFTTVTDGTKGLFQLSRETGDRAPADAAAAAIRWLVANTRVKGQPLFYNIIDPDTGAIWTDRSPHHPQARPASLTQVARPNIEGSPFADMCEWTGDKSMCALQVEIAEGLLSRQHANGLWMDFEPNDPISGRIHPRFNIWYAESLIRTFDMTKDQRFLDAATKAMQAMAALQRPDGAILYDNFEGKPPREGSHTGSAVAFAGHQWLKLQQRGVAGFEANIERSLAWVLANRYPADHPDPNLAGAFLDTRVRSSGGRTSIVNRGDIAASFALRFLTAVHRDRFAPKEP